MILVQTVGHTKATCQLYLMGRLEQAELAEVLASDQYRRWQILLPDPRYDENDQSNIVIGDKDDRKDAEDAEAATTLSLLGH